MKRSRRYFVRLFSSILAIAVLIVLLEIVIVTISAYNSSRRWPAFIASEYVKEVEEEIKTNGKASPDAMISSIISASNEIVSGVIIRDERGKPSIFYGELFEGSGKQTLFYNHDGELAYSSEISAPTAEDSDIVSLKIKTFTFHLDKQSDGTYSFSAQDTGVKKTELYLPPNIKRADVAASVSIYSDDTYRGSFDIIVFGISSYPPAKFLSGGLIFVIILLIPISLVIAVIASYYVSKKNSKAIEELKSALSSLAQSDYDIALKKRGTIEYDEISDSIMNLSATLKRNQEARKEWLRSISHDLNTPITSLKMLTDGASDGVFPLDKNLLDSIRKEIDSLSLRIASVTYYSKLISPDVIVNRSEISLIEILNEVISMFASPQRFIIEGDDMIISSDQSLLKRALYEVLDNALKYSSDKVVIKIEKDKIKVISSSHLPSSHPDFFEPWARGDLSRHEGGSGMGLPITGAIMTLLKGRITLEEVNDSVVATFDFKER